METREKTAQETHPLADIEYIYDWQAWKEIWRKSKTAEERIGLLHVGLGVRVHSREEQIERIIFYLDIADGHDNISAFGFGETNRSTYQPIETSFGSLSGDGYAALRQKVSQKALGVLALKFFKPYNELDQRVREFPPEWRLITDPTLFEKLMWFFRAEEGKNYLYNLSFWNYPGAKEATKEIFTNFIKRFIKFLLTFEHLEIYRRDSDLEIQKRFKEAWPEIVNILYCTRETRIFLEQDYFHVLEDKRCEKRLQGIIMGREFSFPGKGKYRKPKTIEEAIFAGSDAARTLLLFRVMRGQKEKFKKIEEAEEMKKQAEKMISEVK